MAEIIYNTAKARMANGALDLDSDTIKMLLLTAAPAGAQDPDLDTVAELLAVSSTTEMSTSGTGYGRQTVSGVTVTQDDTNNRANITHSNVSFGALNGGTIAAVVYYESVDGTDANDRLISMSTGSLVTNGGTVTVSVSSDWLRLA